VTVGTDNHSSDTSLLLFHLLSVSRFELALGVPSTGDIEGRLAALVGHVRTTTSVVHRRTKPRMTDQVVGRGNLAGRGTRGFESVRQV
jgi:hypothetical protein